jgi:hypothetical protein
MNFLTWLGFFFRLKFEFEPASTEGRSKPKGGAGKPASPQEVGRRLTSSPMVPTPPEHFKTLLTTSDTGGTRSRGASLPQLADLAPHLS